MFCKHLDTLCDWGVFRMVMFLRKPTRTPDRRISICTSYPTAAYILYQFISPWVCMSLAVPGQTKAPPSKARIMPIMPRGAHTAWEKWQEKHIAWTSEKLPVSCGTVAHQIFISPIFIAVLECLKCIYIAFIYIYGVVWSALIHADT